MTEKELQEIKEKTEQADRLIAIIKYINWKIPELEKCETCSIEITREEYNSSYDPQSLGWGNSEYNTIKTLINADSLGMNPVYFTDGLKGVILKVLLEFRAEAQEKLNQLEI